MCGIRIGMGYYIDRFVDILKKIKKISRLNIRGELLRN